MTESPTREEWDDMDDDERRDAAAELVAAADAAVIVAVRFDEPPEDDPQNDMSVDALSFRMDDLTRSETMAGRQALDDGVDDLPFGAGSSPASMALPLDLAALLGGSTADVDENDENDDGDKVGFA